MDRFAAAEDVVDVARDGDGWSRDGELGPFENVDVEEEGGGEAAGGGEPKGAAGVDDWWCWMGGGGIVTAVRGGDGLWCEQVGGAGG